VNSAIGNQTNKVNANIITLGVAKSLNQHGHFAQLVFLNILVYPHQILVNYSTSANVQVSNLRISHLAIR